MERLIAQLSMLYLHIHPDQLIRLFFIALNTNKELLIVPQARHYSNSLTLTAARFNSLAADFYEITLFPDFLCHSIKMKQKLGMR